LKHCRDFLRPFWAGVLIVCLGLLFTMPVHATEAQKTGSLFSILPGANKAPGFSGAETFLKPDKAFIFTAEVQDANTVIARWRIADGYYLYQDKFSFKFKDDVPLAIGQPLFPTGKFKEDEYFGRMEVYYHEVEIVLPLQRRADGRLPAVLEVRYQGCADQGFCYPPMKQTIDLLIPGAGGAMTVATVSGTSGPGALPEQDRIARSLATDSLWLSLLGFFGFGLLLAFTPCVLPMLPILSSIIIGQGKQVSTRRAFLLSSSYVMAMAVTYTAAGVAAALFGSNLQIMFQNPWVLGSFSALFVLLALSMFGLYQIQMPASLQSRLAAISQKQAGGTYVGSGVMGFLSALIVGPCVAAPLAGILIYIGMTGDAWLGGLSLFALSMGMGVPLIIFGTSAGKILPKVGPWMDTIKNIFGVMLLAVAIWLLERIIPAPAALLLWAALLIIIAVYMGAFDRMDHGASRWRRLWKGSGLVMSVYGVILIVGAASGGDDVLQPLQGMRLSSGLASGEVVESRAAPVFKQVKGLEGIRREVVAAAARNQPVMVDFYADWCIDCKRMEKRTFSDPRVRESLDRMVLLQADVTDNDPADQALLRQYGLFGPPAILFFDSQGNELRQFRVVGFLDPDAFSGHARAALANMI